MTGQTMDLELSNVLVTANLLYIRLAQGRNPFREAAFMRKYTGECRTGQVWVSLIGSRQGCGWLVCNKLPPGGQRSWFVLGSSQHRYLVDLRGPGK